MKNKELIIWIILAIVLLVVGFLVGMYSTKQRYENLVGEAINIGIIGENPSPAQADYGTCLAVCTGLGGYYTQYKCMGICKDIAGD